MQNLFKKRNFRFRFRITANSNKDLWMLDDIEITGNVSSSGSEEEEEEEEEPEIPEVMTRGLGSIAEMKFPHYTRRFKYSRPYEYIRHRAMMGRIARSSEGDEVSTELDVARELGDRMHMSTTSVIKEFLPYLRIIQENNPEVAAAMLRSVGISDEEMCDLPYG